MNFLQFFKKNPLPILLVCSEIESELSESSVLESDDEEDEEELLEDELLTTTFLFLFC